MTPYLLVRVNSGLGWKERATRLGSTICAHSSADSTVPVISMIDCWYVAFATFGAKVYAGGCTDRSASWGAEPSVGGSV